MRVEGCNSLGSGKKGLCNAPLLELSLAKFHTLCNNFARMELPPKMFFCWNIMQQIGLKFPPSTVLIPGCHVIQRPHSPQGVQPTTSLFPTGGPFPAPETHPPIHESSCLGPASAPILIKTYNFLHNCFLHFGFISVSNLLQLDASSGLVPLREFRELR